MKSTLDTGNNPGRVRSAAPHRAVAWWPALVLAVATLAVYLPALKNGFVNYDDPEYVTENPRVQAGLTIESVAWAFRTGHASNWHPLTWLSHMLDCEVFGVRPGPAHLVSIAFHAVNAVLLFLLLRLLTGSWWRSWFVAALFALHPLHVESVAWIAERKDVLSTFFLLLTLAAYVRYAREDRSKWKWYALALLMFACGLMSKPMLVTLPFLLLLLDFWPLRRIGPDAVDKWRLPTGLLAEKAPFFLLTVVSSAITFLVQQRGGAVTEDIPFGPRVANAFVSCARYLHKTIWPLDLAVFYPHPGSWPVSAVLFSAALVSGISVLAVLGMKRRPYLAVGWFWFLGTLVPVIGLVQVGMQSMADRYSYVPLIGIFWAAVWGIAEPVKQRSGSRIIALGAGACFLVFCSALTARQLGSWRDSGTLFRHALGVTKNNFLAHNNLGVHYSKLGGVQDEIDEYRKSLAINPQFVQALNNLGSALSGQKRFEEALPYYEEALRLAPTKAEIRVNVANTLNELGRLDAAIPQYELALQADPRNPTTHSQIGVALARKGEIDRAIHHFQQAVALRPTYSDAYANLGNSYAIKQEWDQTARAYTRALELKPQEAQLHLNLAIVLTRLNKHSEAAARYQETMRLQPHPNVAYQLGLARLRAGDASAAAQSFKEALRLQPDHREAARELEKLK